MKQIPAIIKVQCFQSIKGHWSYVATTEGGEAHTVRRKSSRLYKNAYLCEDASGNGKGLMAHFAFGKNPPHNYRRVIQTIPITLIRP